MCRAPLQFHNTPKQFLNQISDLTWVTLKKMCGQMTVVSRKWYVESGKVNVGSSKRYVLSEKWGLECEGLDERPETRFEID
ncbi:MAG: hypothetical protein A2Z14_18420 [Chloroflexi bacterium RBG_16_48_8]|nr:MAG: hypothetical protein A2Z14_18420 [Chloroflexi bacterium RBG_16_48_8]